MAGVSLSRVGEHRTITERLGVSTVTLTAAEMREIIHTEGQDPINVLESMLIELQSIKLGVQIGAEEDLEIEG